MGHLVAGIADWAALLIRWKWAATADRHKLRRTRR